MQTTKLKLVLEPDVAVPDTGHFTGSTNALQNTVTVVAVIAILAIVTTIVGIAIYRLYKAKKIRLFTPILLVFGLLSGMIAPVLVNNRTFAADDYDVDFEAPEEVTMEGAITKATLTTGKIIITAKDATKFGYGINADPNEINKDSNFIPKTDGNKTEITSIEEAGKLTANTYGFTTKKDAKAEDEVWLPLGLLDYKSAATDADDTTDIYFGVLTDDTVLADTYELSIDFWPWVISPNIDGLTYMQEFKDLTDDERDSVLESMIPEKQYQLKDSRDGKTYYIAKLKDGNVWMTQNLDLDLDNTRQYTHDDTDLGWGGAINVNATWKPTNSTLQLHDDGRTFDSLGEDDNRPKSLNVGDWYYAGGYNGGQLPDLTGADVNYLTSENRETVNGVVYINNGDGIDYFANAPFELNGMHGHVGNYYNWSAAVASNDTDGYTDSTLEDIDNNPQSSICPAGWRLPTVSSTSYEEDGSNNEFARLVYLYNNNNYVTDSTAVLEASPLFFTRVGFAETNRLGNVAGTVTYWSSTVSSDSVAYMMSFSPVGVNPQNVGHRYYGYSVRCIAR